MPCALTPLLNHVCMLVAPQCTQKQIQPCVQTPDCTNSILTDQVRLEQILVNLLTSSVKFTPAGGIIELAVRARLRADGRISCTMLVRDNGIGMSQTFQAHMFEPFAQEFDEIVTQMQ